MKKHTLDHLKDIPLWKILEEEPEKELILDEQGIRGLYQLLFNTKSQDHFKLQKRRNLHYLEAAQQFLAFYKNTQRVNPEGVYYLKGACFIGELYPSWGERFMSDIDIYCKDMEAIEEAALSYGMKRTNPDDAYWLGNGHKREYYLETDLGIIPFEFHSKLFWHCQDPDDVTYHEYLNLPGIGIEETLVFLIGHYAFQHTCQKLYWLFDIYLFILKFDENIDYKKFHSLINFFGFNSSLLFTKKILQQAFNFDWFKIKKNTHFPLRKKFIFEDSQRHWYYLCLKWYLKNGLKNNIHYAYAWLKH